MKETKITAHTLPVISVFGTAKIQVIIELPQGRTEIELSSVQAADLIASLAKSMREVAQMYEENKDLLIEKQDPEEGEYSNVVTVNDREYRYSYEWGGFESRGPGGPWIKERDEDMPREALDGIK